MPQEEPDLGSQVLCHSMRVTAERGVTLLELSEAPVKSRFLAASLSATGVILPLFLGFQSVFH